MAEISGDTVIFYQGETPHIRFNVVDSDNDSYDLTGGAAVLTYRKGTGAVVNVPGVITGTTVDVSFTHATTQMMKDMYVFQLMCRNASGEIVMCREGSIDVKASQDPDAVNTT